MTHPVRSLSFVLALGLALAMALPGPTARGQAPAPGGEADAGASTKADKKAEKQAAEEAAKAAKREREQAERAAKAEAKEQKEGKSSKRTKEQQRRELIESGARTAPDWYAQALQLYQRGRYLDARSILLPLEDSARAVDIQERVKLLIADTYFEQGGALNLAEALARYKSYLTFFPGSEHAAYAQYQLGRSYFKQLGDPDRDQSFTDQAIFEYQKLIDNYPESEFTAQARKDVLEAKARRAQHEFEVAQFYWDWNDKAACATRLMQVLKERPELPSREKALYMCAQSLYDTGRRDEGDAYAARLAADYPGSQFVSRLNASSTTAVAKQASRDRKREKEAARTYRAQQKSDLRRTRIIRKDSGLPGDVPQTWDLSGSMTPVAASAEPASGPSAEEIEKQRKREEAQREAAAKAEAEEQARAAKDAEREAKKEQERQREAEKKAAEAAKKAEATASETPEQKAKREKQEAKAKAEADRLEAEERRRAEKQAEADAKREAKEAKEGKKKKK